MERDLERLNKVAQRFSHVGSAPELQPAGRHAGRARRRSRYMSRRAAARADERRDLQERYEPVPDVLLNRELIEWALENLITNALSALDKRAGPDRGDVLAPARRATRSRSR